MKKCLYILAALAIGMSVSSCYKIINTTVPSEAVPGETFQVVLTVADDGSSQQDFVTDWSVAGVRVPEGWTVTVPAMAHRQYAEDWVYYPDGTKVAKKAPMLKNDKLTSFYNSACPKNGYAWTAFQSRAMIPKNMTACWRNGCDSITITFNVQIPEDCAPGTYTVDFIGGDEEDAAGVDHYNSHTDAKGTRLFHVGTFTHSYIEQKYPKMSKKIVVAAPTGISAASTTDKNTKIYTVDGKQVAQPQKGINIVNGKKMVK